MKLSQLKRFTDQRSQQAFLLEMVDNKADLDVFKPTFKLVLAGDRM